MKLLLELLNATQEDNYSIMRRISTTIIAFLYMAVVFAIPSKQKFELSQIDGSTLILYIVGDEFFHYHITEDGYPVIQSNDNGWYYAYLTHDDMLPSKTLVHNIDCRTKEELSYINQHFSDDYCEHIADISRLRHQRPNSDHATRSSYRSSSYKGLKKGLVILVNFSDNSFSSSNPQHDYDRMFNEQGYSENNHVGSVHDYFYDQSYGSFDLTFDVVGPITLPNKISYYGANGVNGNDKDAHIMVREACTMIADEVDFKQYDWNDDGEVDQVFIIYAGYGEATGGMSSTIWPHESYLKYNDEGILNLGDITINQYACSNELYGVTGKIRMGIGTPCHEFCHCLGLPDTYDTDYSGAFGMDGYDIMCSGGHSGPNGIGEIPYGFTAYERWYVGWLDLIDIATEEFISSVKSLSEEPVAYRICNSAVPDECFVLENHQIDKWFSYIGNNQAPHGLMITHIDYDEKAWNSNLVNPNKNHQRMSIIPADNSYGNYNSNTKRYILSDEEIQGDFFPGIKNVNRMSSISHKETGGTLFNANNGGTNNMELVIDNIVEDNGLLSFSVGYIIPFPEILEASLDESNCLYIRWEDQGNSDSYSIELNKILSYFPLNIEKTVINDIIGNSLSINDIDCKQCTVRIKSKGTFASSEWSDYFKISSSGDTSIITIVEDRNDNNCHFDINGYKTDRTKGLIIHKNGEKSVLKLIK